MSLKRTVSYLLLPVLFGTMGTASLNACDRGHEEANLAAPVAPDIDDPIPLPRDPEIAVREELDLAIEAGTAEALALFIDRYADHPLAEEARQRLQTLD